MKKAIYFGLAFVSLMSVSVLTHAGFNLPPTLVPHAAPEIDAAGAAIALAFLVGLVGIKREMKANKRLK